MPEKDTRDRAGPTAAFLAAKTRRLGVCRAYLIQIVEVVENKELDIQAKK